MKNLVVIASLMVMSFVAPVQAATVDWDIYRCCPVTTSKKDLFKSIELEEEKKRPYDAPYEERFRDNRYRPHYVFYKEKNTWLNVSVVPALETENRDLLLYYTSTQKIFRVHFRNTEEANAATRILLDGLNMPLPPYYVTEE